MQQPQPSLDTWTTFFLLAAGHGIFLAFMLFFNKRGNQAANRILGLFIFCFALTLVDYVGHWTKYHYYFPYLANMYKFLAFLFGPLLFLYFKRIEEDTIRWSRFWLHFIPFLLMLVYLAPWFMIPGPSKVKLLQGVVDEVVKQRFFFPFVPYLVPSLIVGHLSIYAAVCYHYIRRQKQQDLRKEEQMSQIRYRWYRVLMGLYLGFVGGYLLYYLLVFTPYFTLFYDYSISIAMTIFIYSVGVLGYKQPAIFSGQALQKVFLAPKYQNSSLTPSASQSLLQKLLAFMETEEPFLDPDLRLAGLAEQLSSTTHHLSQVINEQLNKSFSDFINAYRVEAAQKMLADQKNKEVYIINIAYASGFNNKTSFNKAFKEMTGCSPSEYRKKRMAKREQKEERQNLERGRSMNIEY